MKGLHASKRVLGVIGGVGLLAAGQCSADEMMLSPVLTKVASTTLSGYVDVSATWTFGSGNQTMHGRPACPTPEFVTPSDISVVPEPSSMALVLAGAAAVLLRKKRGWIHCLSKTG
jgi:hypothetical protein